MRGFVGMQAVLLLGVILPVSAQNASQQNSATPANQPNKDRKANEAEQNPFPEAKSQAAAKQEQAKPSAPSEQPLQLQPMPSVSSSSAQMSPEDLGETKIKHHGREDEFTRDLNLNGRVTDDLHVADFYQKDWNYRGAYLRYKDALRLDPGNEDAMYGVAETACQMKNPAEALAGFKSYLQQYPKGQYAKKAEKALSKPKDCEPKK